MSIGCIRSESFTWKNQAIKQEADRLGKRGAYSSLPFVWDSFQKLVVSDREELTPRFRFFIFALGYIVFLG